MSNRKNKGDGDSLEQMLGKIMESTPALANVIFNLSQKADQLEAQVRNATPEYWLACGESQENRTLH